MRYLTDRKRAEGKGSAHHGTEHNWYMQVSGVGLAFLIPATIFCLGRALSLPAPEAMAFLGNPAVAILLGLAIFVGMRHAAKGAAMMIEDYARGYWRRSFLIAAVSLTYLITAIGLYALVVLSLKG